MAASNGAARDNVAATSIGWQLSRGLCTGAAAPKADGSEQQHDAAGREDPADQSEDCIQRTQLLNAALQHVKTLVRSIQIPDPPMFSSLVLFR